MIIKVPIVTVSNEEEYYCCCKDLRCSTKGNSVEKVEKQIVQMIKSVLTPLDIESERVGLVVFRLRIGKPKIYYL